jgi:type I restriction enzyme, S subunit
LQTVRPYQKNNLFFDKNGVYVASTGYAQIRTKETSRFLYQYMHFQNFVNKVIERCTGTSYPAINSTDLSNITISFPKIPEQQKIATFLTSIDNKLTQLKQKKILLELYKKGVMQKLFSQELRFKDEKGKEFPKWGKEKIKGYIDFLSGYAFKGEDISEDSSGIPLLRGVSITEGKLRRSEEIDRYFCGEITKINKYFLKKGDLVIGMDGSKVGRNSALVDLSFDSALLVQRVARIRGSLKGYLPFIYHHINSSLFHRYVDEVKTSSGIPHISATQINDFKIYFPCYQEQVKIANFLTAIDDKLKRTENQILQTEQYKKGLLQNMFI